MASMEKVTGTEMNTPTGPNLSDLVKNHAMGICPTHMHMNFSRAGAVEDGFKGSDRPHGFKLAVKMGSGCNCFHKKAVI